MQYIIKPNKKETESAILQKNMPEKDPVLVDVGAEFVTSLVMATLTDFLRTNKRYNSSEYSIRRTGKGNYKLMQTAFPQMHPVVVIDGSGKIVGGTESSNPVKRKSGAPIDEVFVAAVVESVKSNDSNLPYAKDVQHVLVSWTKNSISFEFVMKEGRPYQMKPVSENASSKAGITHISSQVLSKFRKTNVSVDEDEKERLFGIAHESLMQAMESLCFTGKEKDVLFSNQQAIKTLLPQAYSDIVSLLKRNLNLNNAAVFFNQSGIILSLEGKVQVDVGYGETKAHTKGISDRSVGKLKQCIPLIAMYKEVREYVGSVPKIAITKEDGEYCMKISHSKCQTYVYANRPWKRETGHFLKEIEEEKAAKTAEDDAKILALAPCGSYLAEAIVDTVMRNEKYITPGYVNKYLRGLKMSSYANLVDTEYKGRFEDISTEDVTETIRKLCAGNVLRTVDRKSDYGHYDILKTTPTTKRFMQLSAQKKGKDLNHKTDHELLELMKSDIGKKQTSATMMKHLMLYLDHPCLFCMDKETVLEYMKQLPEEGKEYLKALHSIEEVPYKKRILKQYISG